MKTFKDQSSILIQVKSMGFTFLVDASCKYNLVTPCFVDFFHEEYPPSLETIESHKWLNLNYPTPKEPIQTSLYLFTDVFQRKKGIKKIKCKDGINRGCESVSLKFEYDGKSYSKLFYIDQSLCSYCVPKNKISGILGAGFLRKHKWA